MGRPAAQLKHGPPCKRCSGTERYLSGGCPTCVKKVARAWSKANPDRVAINYKLWRSRCSKPISAAVRAGNYRRRYGLSTDEYNSLLSTQFGSCAICGGRCPTGKRLGVDHNHATGVVRGLLCLYCNHGIGNFKDDPTLLLKAIQYLRKK